MYTPLGAVALWAEGPTLAVGGGIVSVALATGQRPIPAWVDRDAVDEQLGAHVSGPRFAATDGGSEIVDAGDEGEVLTDEEGDHRPEECDCAAFHGRYDIPCWPCYRAGFDVPNPSVK